MEILARLAERLLTLIAAVPGTALIDRSFRYIQMLVTVGLSSVLLGILHPKAASALQYVMTVAAGIYLVAPATHAFAKRRRFVSEDEAKLGGGVLALLVALLISVPANNALWLIRRTIKIDVASARADAAQERRERERQIRETEIELDKERADCLRTATSVRDCPPPG